MAGVEASTIGAAFENYQGNAGLANPGIGVLNIDTRPLNQLAAYTTMYNKSVWEQQQKDTDAKVKELANLSSIALNNLRGKDKDQLTKDYNDLIKYAAEYVRKTPKNQQEKLEQELEWQTKYGAFINNYNSGKSRSVAYLKRLNDINSSESTAKIKDKQIAELDKEFDGTDIGTQISATPNYKLQTIDVPDPTISKVNFVAIDGNDNLDVETSIFIPAANTGKADATVVGIGKAYPKKTIKDASGKDIPNPEYDALSDKSKSEAEIQGEVESNGKIWSDMTDPLNVALKDKKYHDEEGNFIPEKFENDYASNSVIMKGYTALKKLDAYSRGKYNEAVNGAFNDNGVSFKLPENVSPDSFKPGFIDFSNGVNPAQLVQAGMFAKYPGDVYNKKVTHTGDQRAFDLEKMRELNAEKMKRIDESGANYRAGLELIGKGFTRDAKGKWTAPAKGAELQAGGVIPYWENYILPQIGKDGLKIVTGSDGFLGFGKTKKEEPVPENFTGDVDVPSDKISGLSVALTGELNAEGKQKSYNNESETKIRFENGRAVGVVIDGVFHDQNQINTRATMLNDKTVSNKRDSDIFGKTDTPPKAAAPVNGPDYYNSQVNVQSHTGNVITYKDGTVWQYDEKEGKLKPLK